MNDAIIRWVDTLDPQTALFYATTTLWLHWLVIVLVVVPVPLFWLGGRRGWKWVRSLWVRLLHLLLIGFIVINTLLGYYCPLTLWENALHARAGAAMYDTDFIAHWLRAFIYISAPTWVFDAVYTVFGALVCFVWVRYPPQWKYNKVEKEPI